LSVTVLIHVSGCIVSQDKYHLKAEIGVPSVGELYRTVAGNSFAILDQTATERELLVDNLFWHLLSEKKISIYIKEMDRCSWIAIRTRYGFDHILAGIFSTHRVCPEIFPLAHKLPHNLH
jgi:hypothetical protein